MKEVRATLLQLFARLPCAAIEASDVHIVDAFKAASFDEIKALPHYNDEYGRVRAAKLELERICLHYSADNGDQPLQCLCLLKDWRVKAKYITDDYAIRRDLIRDFLYKDWSLSDRECYDQRRMVIEEWTDFFLSYTNRESVEINNRYRTLISHKLGWPGNDKISKSNYVARVIAKFFESENLRAFVDFKVLECGDDIGQKIVQHCRSTIAFVQLVQKEALSEPPLGSENWCHIEYREFVGATFPSATMVATNRRFFVLSGAGQLDRPLNMSQPYEPWYDEMSRRLHVVIDLHDRKPWDQLKGEVSAIARQIVSARGELVNAMLSSWH